LPITATSYESQVSAALVSMLATAASFTAGGGSRALIAEDDGGHIRDPKNADGNSLVMSGIWAVVRVNKCRSFLRALNTYGHDGDAQILIVIPRNVSESVTDGMRRARNIGGGIRDDMNAMWGTVISSVPTPASGEINVTECVLADDTGPLAGKFFIHLEIAWSDIP
jgi:hypothetical protein